MQSAFRRIQTHAWSWPSLTGVALAMLLVTGCRDASAGPSAPPQDSREKTTMPQKLSAAGYDISPLSRERVEELARRLDPETYKITQKAGTERAFCGTLLDNKKDGLYACVVCGLPLFSSAHKFDSGTGWPSFFREFDPQHVARKPDNSYGMQRTEIDCARCGSHLGHVFEDGPPPTGERHCLNSASLKFFEAGQPLPPESRPASQPASAGQETAVAYFAAGCFWGVEHYFQKGPGVLDAVSGYMQGETPNPTYKQVCSGETGHAETVKVVYDPRKITYRRLLEAFFVMHDPTQVDRQGPDFGTQYRSGIWYVDAEQKRVAEEFVREMSETKFKGRKIATRIEPAKTFYPAEDYHQDYVEKSGRACHVTNPW